MRMQMRALACVWGVIGAAAPTLAQDGPSLYGQYCSRCHDGGIVRAPSRWVISQLTPERIVAALDTGTMRVQGAERTPAERRAIMALLPERLQRAHTNPG